VLLRREISQFFQLQHRMAGEGGHTLAVVIVFNGAMSHHHL